MQNLSEYQREYRAATINGFTGPFDIYMKKFHPTAVYKNDTGPVDNPATGPQTQQTQQNTVNTQQPTAQAQPIQKPVAQPGAVVEEEEKIFGMSKKMFFALLAILGVIGIAITGALIMRSLRNKENAPALGKDSANAGPNGNAAAANTQAAAPPDQQNSKTA